jgi:hypothetical protein
MRSVSRSPEPSSSGATGASNEQVRRLGVACNEQPARGQHVVVVHHDPWSHRQLPAALDLADAGAQHALGDAGSAVAQHPAGAHEETNLAQVLPGALDHAAVGADDDLAAAGVAAEGEADSRGRDGLVLGVLGVGRRQEARVGVPDGGGRPQVGEVGGGHGRGGRPAHAEVALDRPGHGRRGDDLARQVRLLGIELDHGVHIGRGAADVDDDHVARAREIPPASSQQLHAGEHDVGGRAGDHRREGWRTWPLAEVLAADHVGQEHLADRGTGRVRGEHADAGHHVVGDHVRRPRERRLHLGAGVDVARDDHGSGPAGLRQAPGRVDDRCGVAAVGAAGQQHDVRCTLVDGAQVVPARDSQHGHHSATAGQGDPAAGLGRDELLVADHGDPQPAACGRARQHLGVVGPGVLPAQRGEARVVPVEHVGPDRRRVRRLGHDPALDQVDERRLGEGGAEVDADRGRGWVSRGHGRGRRAGRRSSRCPR